MQIFLQNANFFVKPLFKLFNQFHQLFYVNLHKLYINTYLQTFLQNANFFAKCKIFCFSFIYAI